jgi:hypothetical protein
MSRWKVLNIDFSWLLVEWIVCQDMPLVTPIQVTYTPYMYVICIEEKLVHLSNYTTIPSPPSTDES